MDAPLCGGYISRYCNVLLGSVTRWPWPPLQVLPIGSLSRLGDDISGVVVLLMARNHPC